MEVKDVRKLDSPSINQDRTEEAGRRKGLGALGAVRVKADNTGVDQVSVKNAPQPKIDREFRSKLNQVINISNVANDATNEIGRYVRSIQGIVQQVEGGNLAPHNREILEKEAKQLLDEIKRKALTSDADGVRPLAGDPIKLPDETGNGGKSETVLPNDASSAFGIGEVSFKTSEELSNAKSSIERAFQGFERLRLALEGLSSQLHESAVTLEVASQNEASAQSSLRDVDAAVKLAVDTGKSIQSDPRTALASLGNLSGTSLGKER